MTKTVGMWFYWQYKFTQVFFASWREIFLLPAMQKKQKITTAEGPGLY
jgi:hypothetical protein